MGPNTSLFIHKCQPVDRLDSNAYCNINLPYMPRSKRPHSFRISSRISIRKFIFLNSRCWHKILCCTNQEASKVQTSSYLKYIVWFLRQCTLEVYRLYMYVYVVIFYISSLCFSSFRTANVIHNTPIPNNIYFLSYNQLR
jgi:hypothetical protein